MSARDPNGVDYSTASSSAAYTAAQQPVSMYRLEGGAVGGEDDQAASSSTLEHQSATGGKLKNKKRQPKYRATKRPPSERRFQCDHCESRFFTQKDVKRHLVVHTGVRNFACPYCTQRFGRKDHLVRHAKKSHDQDTRSFKRRARQAPPGAPSASATELTAKRPPNRKGSSRSRRKAGETERDQPFQPSSSASNATISTTSITSLSTSYFLPDNGFDSSLNRAAAATSTHPHFSNSTIMLSSTSTSPLTPFPKMTLVDVHPSTSTLTASLTHPRNYHSSFNYDPSTSAAGPNFNYSNNGASAAVAPFNPFLPPQSDGSAAGSQYALQLSAPPPLPAGNVYLNYDYKPPPPNTSLNYPGSGSSSHHEAFNSGHLSGHSNGAGNLSFKTITAEGFNNTCIELEYSAAAAAPAGMAGAFGSTGAPAISSSSVPFGGESGQHVATRFHSPFN